MTPRGPKKDKPLKIQLNTHLSIDSAVLRQTNANLHKKCYAV